MTETYTVITTFGRYQAHMQRGMPREQVVLYLVAYELEGPADGDNGPSYADHQVFVDGPPDPADPQSERWPAVIKDEVDAVLAGARLERKAAAEREEAQREARRAPATAARLPVDRSMRACRPKRVQTRGTRGRVGTVRRRGRGARGIRDRRPAGARRRPGRRRLNSLDPRPRAG